MYKYSMRRQIQQDLDGTQKANGVYFGKAAGFIQKNPTIDIIFSLCLGSIGKNDPFKVPLLSAFSFHGILWEKFLPEKKIKISPYNIQTNKGFISLYIRFILR